MDHHIVIGASHQAHLVATFTKNVEQLGRKAEDLQEQKLNRSGQRLLERTLKDRRILANAAVQVGDANVIKIDWDVIRTLRRALSIDVDKLEDWLDYNADDARVSVERFEDEEQRLEVLEDVLEVLVRFNREMREGRIGVTSVTMPTLATVGEQAVA